MQALVVGVEITLYYREVCFIPETWIFHNALNFHHEIYLSQHCEI
jgi:hypothetical protein